MNRAPLTSSMIVSAGYEASTRILELEFSPGHVYQYFDVPPELYPELLGAPSAGRFFHARIRNAFRCNRVLANLSAQ